MIIQVTKRDIDSGRRQNCEACPIALAIKRVVKSRVQVSVNGDIGFKYGEHTIPTPSQCKLFMAAFDHREHVEPFEFELDIPAKYARKAA